MKVSRELSTLHPILIEVQKRIQTQIIDYHNMPIRLFEAGREHSRHHGLMQKGKTKDVISGHLFNLNCDPPLYATAIDYVYYDGKWSWNIRNATIRHWYKLFGYLVLAHCPELEWGGVNRDSTNYNHFQLRERVLLDNLEKFPCTIF